MKIWTLLVVFYGEITHKREFLTKRDCESAIRKDEYGSFVIGEIEGGSVTIYNDNKESIESKNVWLLRKKRVGFDITTVGINYYETSFMCVESTL